MDFYLGFYYRSELAFLPLVVMKGPHPALRATFSKEKGRIQKTVASPWRSWRSAAVTDEVP
jgi:hypothetical protein